MKLNGTQILDTFAEAFPIWLSRVIITAETAERAYKAAVEATGFATSTIYCPCEVASNAPSPGTRPRMAGWKSRS